MATAWFDDVHVGVWALTVPFDIRTSAENVVVWPAAVSVDVAGDTVTVCTVGGGGVGAAGESPPPC